jgi:hypothetical protein
LGYLLARLQDDHRHEKLADPVALKIELYGDVGSLAVRVRLDDDVDVGPDRAVDAPVALPAARPGATAAADGETSI